MFRTLFLPFNGLVAPAAYAKIETTMQSLFIAQLYGQLLNGLAINSPRLSKNSLAGEIFSFEKSHWPNSNNFSVKRLELPESSPDRPIDIFANQR